MDLLTTAQAAAKLGVSPKRIQAMIAAFERDGPGRGRLKATKFGHVWMIAPADLKAVKDREPGRPRATK